MMFSLMAVASFAAIVEPKQLGVTAEVNASALSDSVSVVTPGSEIELTIKLPEKAAVGLLQLKINHSETQMEYKGYENGVVFGEPSSVLNGKGFVQIDFESETDVSTFGELVVVKFTLAAGFHGDLSFSVEGSALSQDPDNMDFYEISGTSVRTYKVHNYGEADKVGASCTANGTVTYTCSSASCTDRVYSYETDMLDHTEGLEPVKELVALPTCTTPGSHNDVYKCTECGAETRRVEGIVDEMLPHTYVTYVSNNDATCTADGTKTAKCENCDAKDTKTDEGSMLPHTYVTYVSNNDATCTADGTKTAKCENCDAKDTKPDEGSKLGHEFLEENYKSNGDATCTEDGKETAKCTRCDQTDVRTDVDSKLGHEFLAENYKSDNNATCTADGTETAKCTRCDETKTQTDEGSMLAHTYGNWTVTTAPTTSAQGEETRTCTACPAKETRPVKKLPVVVTAPTEAWEKGDGDMVFKSDADFADFESVTVNGEVLAAENYTVKEGSIIVTLSEKYLKTLENGTYTICIKSANGVAESTFTVENSSGWIVAIVIIAAVVVCAGVVVGVVFYKKKKSAN